MSSVGGVHRPPPGGAGPVQPTGAEPLPQPKGPDKPSDKPTAPVLPRDNFAPGETGRVGLPDVARQSDGTVGRPEPRPEPGEVRVDRAPTTAPAPGRPTEPGKMNPGGIVIPGQDGQPGVFIPAPPVALPVPEAPVFPVNPSIKNLLDPKNVPPSTRTDKTEQKDAMRGQWNWVLPPADYRVDLPQFKGWEGTIPRAELPEGGVLERAGVQHAIEVPFGGGKRMKAEVDANGRFKAPMPGREDAEEVRGRIEGPQIVVERWTAGDERSRMVAQYRANLPPPYPIVPSGERVVQPLDLEAIEREAGGKRMTVATVVNLVNDVLQVYFATGEVLSLPPRGSAPVTAWQLDSPHIAELRRAGCIDVIPVE